MNISNNQSGSSHIVLFLGLAVIVAVSLVGVRVMKNTETNPAATLSTARSTSAPSSIKSKADVVQASRALSQTSIDSSVNPNQLDSDLNSLL